MAGLYHAFVSHDTERYGAKEIRTWYFEVWNEPNLTGFWMGTTGGKSYDEFAPIARAEYFKLYETTERAVKSVDAAYRVGGPATAGSGWIDETLAYCAGKGLPLDFVSTHSYATTSGYLDENGNAGTVFSTDRDAITGEVKGVRARMDRSAFAAAELHYTEWSSSYTPFDPLHDSYHSAAFILDKIRNIGASAASMSYWTFTDIFEEAGPRMTPFHGGFGLLNYQDLPKPSYFAYQFLNRLGEVELNCHDPDSLRLPRRGGRLQALFWDFTITHPGAGPHQPGVLQGRSSRMGKRLGRVATLACARGAYRLLATKVGYRANDVQAAWRDLGSPSQLYAGPGRGAAERILRGPLHQRDGSGGSRHLLLAAI